MNKKTHSRFMFLIMSGILMLAFLFSLVSGTSEVGIRALLRLISGVEKNSDVITIFYEFRLPKTITAIASGSALAVSGLLMQTLFRNPLAGPYVLGITGGANLFVAIAILGTTWLGVETAGFISSAALPFVACCGALFALMLVMIFSANFKSTTSLLLVGIMLGFIFGAVQNVLEFFSGADELKRFSLWNMGSLGNVLWNDLFVLIPAVGTGIFLSFFLSKNLDLFLFGDDYASTMGLILSRIKWQMILLTGLLSGVSVAYCGPIAFIGLAVPHLCRILWKTQQHRILIPAVVITGATLLLFCDAIGNLFSDQMVLPINVTTSLFGAPFVIYLLLSNKKAML